MKVGYVGLGAMGRALAGHLIENQDLLVWDLNPQAVADFVARGAKVAISLADMGAQCGIVILCLPKSANVEQALFGEEGLAGTMAPGSIVVDQTSGVPDQSRAFARRLADRGVTMIDAPVAGGVPSAIAGQITIMASGPADAFATARPVLASISPKVHHCSTQVGDGQAAKAINNMINAAYRMTTLEILAVGRRLGLSAAAITDALNAGEGRSFISYRLLPAVAEGRSSTDFALTLMVKDLNQAADLGAAAATPMPISDTARGLMNAALNLLGQDSRLDDVVPFLERLTCTQFTGEPAADAAAPALDEQSALRLITNAAAACNRAIVMENTALAIRAGMDIAGFAPVINSGSASSAQAEGLFALLQGDDAALAGTVSQMLDSVTALTRVADACFVPMLMTNQVRAQYLSWMLRAGPDCSMQDVMRFQTSERTEEVHA